MLFLYVIVIKMMIMIMICDMIAGLMIIIRDGCIFKKEGYTVLIGMLEVIQLI